MQGIAGIDARNYSTLKASSSFLGSGNRLLHRSIKEFMGKNKAVRNVWVSVVQVTVSGLILFLLYRYLLETIGVEQVGIWSLVLATTSASRITELGLSGGVLKFVAKYNALADMDQASRVIQTAAISIAVLIGGTLITVHPLIIWLLEHVISAEALPGALSVLPYALTSLWLTTLIGVFQSGLDGCQRFDLRGLVMIIGSVLYLLLVLIMVPQYGLLGLGLSQVLQAGVVLLLSWIMLWYEMPALPLLPRRWTRLLFKQMFTYGVSFQLTGIAKVLYEPITKALLSKFGDLAMVGYYEMANRMILQLRQLLIAANQVLVPIIAGLQETMPERIQSIYRDSYRLLIYLTLPFYMSIIAIAPIISELWIGRFEKVFTVFVVMIALAMFINNLTSPAYFVNLGTGRLRWNTVSHVITAILTCILGTLLGMSHGGMGVVVASVLALVSGSCIVVFAYHFEHGIPLQELLPAESWLLAIITSMGAGLTQFFYMYFYQRIDLSILGLFCVMSFIGIIALPVWFHPMRVWLLNWLKPSAKGQMAQVEA